MQSVSKLMDQGSSAVMTEHSMSLKVAGQGNDWCLVGAIALLPAAPQCEVRCMSKLPGPAVQTRCPLQH